MGQLADAYADPDLGAFDLGFFEGGVQVRRSLAAKRILSPRFPNRTPVGRHLVISEDHHPRLATLYENGMTAAQAWHELIDKYDTWVSPSVVGHHFALFDLTRGITHSRAGE
ncbi:hypothetical protein [Streptomyces sp. SH5]|uniref:hypothetical protein n=1 Tax=Streptomyces sp. SH5 TaxID=3041765 RepID=UPI002477D4DC|nr:hypothetical protein [Streptomyces sp. SH5]WGP13100.1 hypothetical protein QFA72_27215 [Streptomyces sp. SH5]